MNNKASLLQKRVRSAFAVIVGAGLLLVLGFSLTTVPSQSEETAGWRLFELSKYGITMKYPANFFVKAAPSINPTTALASFIFAPVNYKSFLAPQAPKVILTIYKHPNSSLIAWFKSHATQKPFDDPSVSMKDSSYFFREFTEPQVIKIAGQNGLIFYARTMYGRTKHVLLSTPDQSYILDLRANESMIAGETAPNFSQMLNTLHWKQEMR